MATNLSRVFDYTSWHQFVVKIDRANGAGRQLLTRKLQGALSGGEKAIALHLPLFAAVAARRPPRAMPLRYPTTLEFLGSFPSVPALDLGIPA